MRTRMYGGVVGEERRLSPLYRFRSVAFSDSNSSFEHFHRCAADARNEFLAGLSDRDLDMAGAAHLRSLQNAQRMPGCEFSMAHEIRAQGARRRTGRGIFILLPWEHAPGTHLAIAVRGEAVRHRGVFPLQLSELDHVHGDLAKSGAVAQRHHQVEDAGGNKFRLEFRVEVLRRKTECRSQFFLIELCWLEERFFLRHGHAVRAAILEADLHEIGRAHVWTPVTDVSRMPSSA